jgi:hypothetical protein
MSASDNLSTKCSGLLLRSSFAILAARARHLYSAGSNASLLGRAQVVEPIRHSSLGHLMTND